MDLDLNFAILEILMAFLAVAVSVLAYQVHRIPQQAAANGKPQPKVPVKAKTPQEKVQEYLEGLNRPSSEKKQEETVSTSTSKPIESTAIALPSPVEKKEEEKKPETSIMELLANG